MSLITVVGAGVVGGATGRGLADAGHMVQFVDVDPTTIAALTADGHNACPSIELLDDVGSFVFLTLPTPYDGFTWDLSAFTEGVASVGRALRTARAFHTVVVRSTVPPGTALNVVRPILERESGSPCGQRFSIASAPEFLRAASALEDFQHAWVTVIASQSRRSVERVSDLMRPFGGALLTYDDPTVAELIKCAHNNFNATKISFFNELWLVARELGVDHRAVASAVALSAEASFNPHYGLEGGRPYGGVCLPKDTKGFIGYARELGLALPLLQATVEINTVMESITEQRLETVHDMDLSESTIAVDQRGVASAS